MDFINSLFNHCSARKKVIASHEAPMFSVNESNQLRRSVKKYKHCQEDHSPSGEKSAYSIAEAVPARGTYTKALQKS